MMKQGNENAVALNTKMGPITLQLRNSLMSSTEGSDSMDICLLLNVFLSDRPWTMEARA
jgi:hypothetical protein